MSSLVPFEKEFRWREQGLSTEDISQPVENLAPPGYQAVVSDNRTPSKIISVFPVPSNNADVQTSCKIAGSEG